MNSMAISLTLIFATFAVFSRCSHSLTENNQDITDHAHSFQDEIRKEVTKLAQENTAMKQQIEQLTTENRQIRQAVGMSQQPGQSVTKPDRRASPEKYTQHSELGCVSDVLELTCPEEKLIFVTHAYYGKYTFACTASCCPPNPGYDCRELVEENRPEDWVAIKYFCDNRTTCEYENRGSPIDECQEGYIADYLQIFYDCIPDSPSQPVGFTVYADTGEDTFYSASEIVHYDGIITNLGEHFNHNTSSFICPYSGVYMFSLNLQSYYIYQMDAYVMRNNDTLSYTMAYTDNSYDRYPAASSLVVTPCERGDVIWVRANKDGYLHAVNTNNLFSGFLLHYYIN